MCELGKRLKEARESRGLELGKAAEALKVRRAVLEALEECRFDELPEPALARGYLKRYAQLLGLDPAPLLALYPSNLSPEPTRTPPPPQPPPLRWFWLLPLALLLAFGAWWALRSAAPSQATPPATPSLPPPPQQVSLRVSTDPSGARVYLDGFLLGQSPLEVRVEAGERTLRVEAPGYRRHEQVLDLQTDRNLRLTLTPLPANPSPTQPSPSPGTPPSGLLLRFEGTSWLRVADGRTGQILFEGTAGPGTQQSYPLPVNVRVGNAGAVRVILNGRDLGVMGNPGQVVNRRFE
ncbi:MAG: DUF4115 domain-containing protein [Meiothermus sp.]|uniref:RodZ domain-containing protein n=1 Tax=Meiothermus sp. TaxID=1955249 RepID=UPI00298F2D92|nr:RodZ domain-containing protein [Meiothermus sp.]MDW8090222.1 DUF4115 domain-containing protein [Meiothermus sp.]